ncbi:d-beta-hydroxybutyrate dehydrogenase, mitochondrial [Caerostris extrusa]|uniref:D-beta-hydroxybutyrate dehydrogenase, mitochondrial n=1 Tax=Caerostris extrusa TaxID=172846 RepID=A0AAV4N297_CAEEX|nr:d-beta-hydroxybutyrate dehydrogenase, mitochondrial [Caerostris extrusa]
MSRYTGPLLVMASDERSELWAIVNNAGILRGLSIETTHFQDFIDSLEVNTLGVVRVTQAFLPLLRKSKGRVVNITSMAGRTKFTFMAPYYMSKHAAVAFNDCLRREMEDWGVKVISIEPDFFATQLVNNELVNKTIDQTISFVPDDIRSDYGENYLNSFKTTKNYFFCFKGSNTNIVINDIDSAISLKHRILFMNLVLVISQQ